MKQHKNHFQIFYKFYSPFFLHFREPVKSVRYPSPVTLQIQTLIVGVLTGVPMDPTDPEGASLLRMFSTGCFEVQVLWGVLLRVTLTPPPRPRWRRLPLGRCPCPPQDILGDICPPPGVSASLKWPPRTLSTKLCNSLLTKSQLLLQLLLTNWVWNQC